MWGGIIFCQGGPVVWIAVWQEKTSLSSCKVEIWATNKISKLVVALRHLAGSVHKGGHNIPYTLEPSPIYNDKEACVCWLHNMITKQIWHVKMHENSVCEWVQDSSLQVFLKGKIDPVTSSPKRCKTELIYDIWEIPLCVDPRISFSSHITEPQMVNLKLTWYSVVL